MDRFALSLAYYLKRRYDAAVEQASSISARPTGANFSRIVLAAAYAQQNRSEDAARVAAMIHRMDPTFDPQSSGASSSTRPISSTCATASARPASMRAASAPPPAQRPLVFSE